MNLVLYTIIRGLAIGILVSAPMGPIGVLCIQRTLNKGRWSGFVTGLGASISDLGYAGIDRSRHVYRNRFYRDE